MKELFYFDVILQVKFEGKPLDALVYKVVRAETEHQARRALVQKYLADGFQVKRLTRVEERQGEVANGGPA